MIHFDISNLKVEIKKLEEKTNEPNFWQDLNSSTPILSKIKEIKNKITLFNKIEANLENIKELNELLILEYEDEIANEIVNSLKNIEKEMQKL